MPSKTSETSRSRATGEKNKDSIKELEKKISPILVINNSALKPYVELFEYQPENIYQQPLGTLIGFFAVKEYSENSAYIVNFLTSVLKKEYYANAKRSIEESFDAALHKVNLALSELAKHGNIEWLGKLDASICVLEKNGAHFSVSGNARMFLWRSGGLTDISEGLADEDAALHPLKTFINVSSGRLEKNDRLFITSDDLFQIMTQNELNKNFQRLDKDKFVQFLKTACSNQLEMIASIVVDIQEEAKKEARPASSTRKKKDASNVFSKAAFEDSPAVIASSNQSEENNALENELADDYTDKKTGHIYVQGENQAPEESGKTAIYFEIATEKIASGWYHAKNMMRRRFVLYKKQLAKSLKEAQEKRKMRSIQRAEERQLADKLRAKEQEEASIKFEAEKLENELRENERKIEVDFIAEIEKTAVEDEKIIPKKISDIAPAIKEAPIKKTTELTFAEKLARAKQFQTPSAEEFVTMEEEEMEIEDVDYGEGAGKNKVADALAATINFSKKIYAYLLAYAQKFKSKVHQKNELAQTSVVPHFSVIKKNYARFSSKQKTIALVALVLVFVIPIFIAKWLNAPKASPITQTEQQPTDPSEIYANEKNIHLQTQGSVIFNDSALLTTLITDSGAVTITKTAIVMPSVSSSKNFPLPASSGNSVRATYMHDLNLVFILTDNGSVVSFAPNVQKYSSNNINLSGISPDSLIGTYLTYLYVLDQQSNQIYRFPRAEGGFGDRASWLKDSASLSNASDMTIDDNIYVLQEGKLLKFFKGKTASTNFEASDTPVHFDHIYTTTDINSFYALDSKNTRLVQYDKTSGTITAQYYNTDLKDASSFSVDEKNKTAYIVTSSGLVSLSLQ